MDNIKKLSANISWLLFGNILTNIISTIIIVYIIRKLPVEAFGIYSLFLGSITFFSIFSDSGILVALRRYIPEILRKGYFVYLKRVVGILYLISLMLAIICIASVFVYKTEIGRLLSIPYFDKYYSIFMINIFFFLQSSVASAILVAIYEQKVVTILELISVFARGVLYILFYKSISLEMIFYIEAATIAITAIPGVIIVFIRLISYTHTQSNDISPDDQRINKKRITRYALLSTTNEMGSSVLSEVSDMYFISYYMGPAAMGLYAFPYKIIKSVFRWIPIQSVNNVFRSFFISKYYSTDEKKTYLNKMFNLLLKIYAMAYGMIISLIICYQHIVNVYLFKSKYIETELLLAVILLFYALRAIADPVNLVMETTENIQYNLYSKVFAIVNAALVICILKFTDYGLIGIAAATGISVFLKNYYIYCSVKRTGFVKIEKGGILRCTTVIIIVLFFMYLPGLIDILPLQIILPGLIGILAFIAGCRMLTPFNAEETNILKQYLAMSLPKTALLKKYLYLTNSGI